MGPDTYLDNATTSFPKPSCVWESARSFLDEIGVSPGRAGHRRARQADEVVEETRRLLARLFNIARPSHIAFAANATMALNECITGVLSPGDRVVLTAAEHNSVLRPVERLRQAGMISYAVIAPDSDGRFDLARFAESLPGVRLVIVNHASNVTGAVAPVPDMVRLAHRAGAVVLLDASQTAGAIDIDVDGWNIDLMAFTGHKSLLGPPGTGGLYVRDPDTVEPLLEGGTGGNSQSLRQPAVMPTKFEAGTLNYVGIAGLKAALEHMDGQRETLHKRLDSVAAGLVDRLRGIAGVRLYAPAADVPRVPIVSFGLDGLYPGELAAVLDEHFGILTRPGLHCAPLMHRTLGTAPHGTVRVSLGPATTDDDAGRLLDAVTQIAGDIPRFMA